MYLNDKRFKNISINADRFNVVLAPNGRGKSSFLMCLRNAYDGKLNNSFIIDGNPVEKDQYMTFYIGETDSLDNEKNLTSKSYLKAELTNVIKDLEDEEKNELQVALDNLMRLVRSIIETQISDGSGLMFEADLKDFLSDNASVKYNGIPLPMLSFTEKRFAYIKLVIKRIKELKRPCVLFVDEPFLGLGKKQRSDMEEYFIETLKNEDVILYISSSEVINEMYSRIYVLNEQASNTLLEDDHYYQMIAIKEQCTAADAFEFTSDEELTRFRTELENIVRIEELFLQSSDKCNSFEDFHRFVITKYARI